MKEEALSSRLTLAIDSPGIALDVCLSLSHSLLSAPLPPPPSCIKGVC